MPLVWSHSEYLKLLRSIVDHREFARLPEVERRYARAAHPPSRIEVWKPRHRPTHIPAGQVLRVQGSEPFRLHWSFDGWTTVSDTESTSTPLGLYYTDLSNPPEGGRVVFTFYWTDRGVWEGQDYEVGIDRPGTGGRPIG
jgi:glucoamylase